MNKQAFMSGYLDKTAARVCHSDTNLDFFRTMGSPGLFPGTRTKRDPAIQVIHNNRPDPEETRKFNESIAKTSPQVLDYLKANRPD